MRGSEALRKLIPCTLRGLCYNAHNRVFGWARKRAHYDSLRAVASEVNPRLILEIGVAEGLGAETMIKATDVERSRVEYHGFDLFGGPPASVPSELPRRIREMREDVQKRLLELGCKVRLVEGCTRETLPKEVPRLPKMDLIHIDGGHDYETVRSDWENSERLMHPKTVVVFDDCLFPDVRRVVDEARTKGYEVRPLRNQLEAQLLRNRLVVVKHPATS